MDERVLVVGTTADYVALIERRWPHRALFVTDAAERARTAEPAPDAAGEVTADLADVQGVLAALAAHRARRRIALKGVSCFDCDSLALAAELAAALALPFATPQAVAAACDKLRSKQLWAEAGVACPRAEAIRCVDEAVDFLRRAGGPIVLKPVTGSGSELLFVCRDSAACAAALLQMQRGLARRRGRRLYRSGAACAGDAGRVVVAEPVVEGTEYSCDFTVAGDELRILRTARKVPADNGVAGITRAYVVPAQWPAAGEAAALRALLLRGAQALGIDHSVCMVDLMLTAAGVVLLEMTPRPGGDCLPSLLRSSGGLDTLGAALDFAEGRPVAAPSPERFRPQVGLRLLAPAAGVLRALDTTTVSEDRRVVAVELKRAPGQRIALPPEDYDSWILGHVIFEPAGADTIEQQCAQLGACVRMEIDPCAP